jgi:hypothetical protein
LDIRIRPGTRPSTKSSPTKYYAQTRLKADGCPAIRPKAHRHRPKPNVRALVKGEFVKKIDYRKELKQLYYAPAKNPEIVDVPRMNFLMIDGEGDPNTTERFKRSVEALFGLSYTLKFLIKKSKMQIDYGVMPLEGLWWADDMTAFRTGKKDLWKWTAMIMQPEHVTRDLFLEAREQFEKKKDPSLSSEVEFRPFLEGKSAQIMHIGPFSEEGPTIEKLHEFIEASGFKLSGKHHEIYLSDLRRSAPEKWKTIIRQPMKG